MRLTEIKNQQRKLRQLKRFAQWAMAELDIETPPKIEYGHDIDKVRSNRTYGSTRSGGVIWVHVGNRTPADAMRTLCHELVHHRQFELGVAHDDMDDQEELAVEDQANAIAGRMMRQWGKAHGDIYEWKFSKSRLTEDEFVRAYNLRGRRELKENPKLSRYPGQLLGSTLRRLNEDKMWENVHQDIKSLIEFQQFLKTVDQRKHVRMAIGSSVSILQFEPHTSTSIIEIRGFTKPKEIVNIDYNSDGEVDWIDFSDGSSYPDKEFLDMAKGGGEYEGISTLFFSEEIQSDQSLVFILLNQPSGWNFGTSRLENRNTLNESRTGSLQHEVADSLPHAFVIPSLNSGNPYLQYKFSVALAAARGKEARIKDKIAPFKRSDLPEVFSDKEMVISYDPHIDQLIDIAMKELGIPGGKRRIGVKGSQESPDVDNGSPVKGFKGFKGFKK